MNDHVRQQAAEPPQRRRYRAANVALSMVLADFLLWCFIFVSGSGLLGTSGWTESRVWLAAAIDCWNVMHAPVNVLLAPYLLPFWPSHGGGWPAVMADTAYVLACLALCWFCAFMTCKLASKLYAGMAKLVQHAWMIGRRE